MILLSVEINCLRGIKNLKLYFNGKNSVIYGDNGTGKSGVIDAIDFLIKGEITRLSGIGSKKSFGHRKNYCFWQITVQDFYFFQIYRE